jgi:hypothetical protein
MAVEKAPARRLFSPFDKLTALSGSTLLTALSLSKGNVEGLSPRRGPTPAPYPPAGGRVLPLEPFSQYANLCKEALDYSFALFR